MINDELYKITKQTQWTKIVAYRRLDIFKHISRLDDKATMPTLKHYFHMNAVVT